MARKINVFVGVRIPPMMVDFIDGEVDKGIYASRADWVRQATREFYEKRVEQNNLSKS